MLLNECKSVDLAVDNRNKAGQKYWQGCVFTKKGKKRVVGEDEDTEEREGKHWGD